MSYFNTNIASQTFTLRGVAYTREQLLSDTFIGFYTPVILSAEQKQYETAILSFLKDWYAEIPTMTLHTSGSTGTPKSITVYKEQMMHSAMMTCEALQLYDGCKALLCLPVHYVAGVMVLVRALVAAWNVIPIAPCGNPVMQTNEQFDFTALIPMQVYNAFESPNGMERLNNIRTIIIGGAAVSTSLESRIGQLTSACYSTYGMTETLSHIALRKLNGKEASMYYHVMQGVNISLSEDETLVVYAPGVNSELLQTNDICEIKNEREFKVLGRRDNVIISGGVKLFVEDIEHKLSDYIRVPFAITAISNERFGEAVVLLVEKQGFEVNKEVIFDLLLPYECPKQILYVDEIPLTMSGKLARKSIRDLAGLLLK